MNSKYKGIIIKVVEQKNIGFIKPEEGSLDIFFHFSVVVEKDRPLLEKYARVKYKYDAEKNKALKIWVIPKKRQIHKVGYAERNNRENFLNTGKLVNGGKGLSVQYGRRTLKACMKNLSIYALQPVENDEVIFTKPTRPYYFLEVVKIKRYTGIRSAGECIKYFKDLDGFLNSSDWCKVIEDVCENKAQWGFFGSLEMPIQEDFDNFFISLLRIINSIMKKSKLFHKPLIQNLLDTILKSKIFRESTIQLQNLMQFLNLDKEQDIFMLFKEFTKSVSKSAPTSLSIMRNFLHAVSKSVPSKNIVELMMYNWNLIAKTQVGGSLDEKWCDIPVGKISVISAYKLLLVL